MLNRQTSVRAGMEFKAVVLAAGKGSRMTNLTCKTPKCLLPIGGLPMLWYPLRLLQDAGFESALVVVSEEMKAAENDILNIPQQHDLRVRLEPFRLAPRDDPGTADALRQLRERLPRAEELVVVSCDLVTAAPLRRLLDLHRLEGAALTALFAAPPADAPVTVPGPKARHSRERDLVGLAEPGPRLCLLASEADFEEEVGVRLALLRRFPRVVVRRDLVDAHLYLLSADLLDAAESRALTSLKGELVPHVVRGQFRRPPPQPPRQEPAARFAAPGETADAGRPACFALTTPALTWRANTTAAYLAANRAATRLWAALPAPTPPRLHPQAHVSVKVRISEDSVVGEESTLSELCQLERSVVGRHCSLGVGVRLTDCVVMDHAEVRDGSQLTNCILMANCRVAERCQLADCVVGVKQEVPADARISRQVISEHNTNMEV